MNTTERFTRREVQRLLDVTEKQLDYWERLRFVSPRKAAGEKAEKSYDFRDLLSLRTAKQLIEQGVPANRLRRSLAVLQQKLAEVQTPLTELRILSNGRDVIVETHGARLEPLSGQFVLNFDARELGEKLRVMPERSADDWFALALQYEADPETFAEAADAYERVLAADPRRTDALINLGTLYYEQANLDKAADCFRRAVELEPGNALAHFNLGSLLDEAGQLGPARDHLQIAVRLDPHHADAHYNLAIIFEKLGAFREAGRHWQRYIELDPTSPWCQYARERLASRPR
ncbi:MAG TPA: tetratricopeptide repeat protein [Candidatus Limnocylindria bacterium]|nr:tetratricopeptide repeat protein [Candidatus Limnocylindria bacterium]